MTSTTLKHTIDKLIETQPAIKCRPIGTSNAGKPIYALTLGQGNKHVLINAAHHGNEWITSIVAMGFLQGVADSPHWQEHTTLHVIPMVNPDGVDLAQGEILPGYKNAMAMAEHYKEQNLYPEDTEDSFPKCWKANMVGVDLNSNYPANWEAGRTAKFERGYNTPGPRDFVGYRPISEPETMAMMAYTLANSFSHTISLHTQGEEIFWQYQDYEIKGAKALATRLAKASGYALCQVPSTSSHGGYRDWFIERFKRPGVTVECGLGKNPLPLTQLTDMYKKVAPLLWEALMFIVPD